MSWYRDPKLFLRCKGPKHRFHVYKIEKKYNVPLHRADFDDSVFLDFSTHLSLGCNRNRETDYDALKSWLNEDGFVTKFVNCEGLVIYRISCSDSCIGTWSRVEENDSRFYSLPGIINNPYEIKLAKKRADEKKISDLEDRLDYEVTKLISEVTYLQAQLNQEKNDRRDQVSDVTTKLGECRLCSGARCGSADVQPWMGGDTSENLDLISTPNNTSVTIMEGSSSSSRVEEDESIYYNLRSITNHSDAEKEAVKQKMSELVAQNSILREKLQEQLNREKTFSKLVADISTLKDKLNNEVTNLQNQLNHEKNERQAQVSDLTAQLEECRGGAGSGIG